MKIRNLLTLMATIFVLAAHSGVAAAITWTGTVTLEGNAYSDVSEFDWNQGPKYDSLNDRVVFNNVTLTALIGGSYSGPFDNVVLGVSFIRNNIADDFFTISDNGVTIARGIFNEAASYGDDSGYTLAGRTTSFDSAAFSPQIYQFELLGMQSFTSPDYVDLSSSFTPVPEPSSVMLAGMGFAALFIIVRKKRNRC